MLYSKILYILDYKKCWNILEWCFMIDTTLWKILNIINSHFLLFFILVKIKVNTLFKSLNLFIFNRSLIIRFKKWFIFYWLKGSHDFLWCYLLKTLFRLSTSQGYCMSYRSGCLGKCYNLWIKTGFHQHPCLWYS